MGCLTCLKSHGASRGWSRGSEPPRPWSYQVSQSSPAYTPRVRCPLPSYTLSLSLSRGQRNLQGLLWAAGERRQVLLWTCPSRINQLSASPMTPLPWGPGMYVERRGPSLDTGSKHAPPLLLALHDHPDSSVSLLHTLHTEISISKSFTGVGGFTFIILCPQKVWMSLLRTEKAWVSHPYWGVNWC